MRVGVCRLRLPEGKASPFNDDVVVLLDTLQQYTRVLEGEIPQIGPFDLKNTWRTCLLIRRLLSFWKLFASYARA
ncbi:hypothetical protein BKA70DRAFT_1247920 [Coprinopsis sp. MPI-PUGE-AT-0042]|nr:hypothetical protein BKA70DRAFT_1247920 [Coprinopsis sp. MPI-PUGE-AT-0042]